MLGWADGLAKANQVRGKDDHVVAVIGDGALTGGMAWEALNNIAVAKDRPLIIVVNDNERSYAPTIGGLADHLATLRTTDGYERFLARGKDILERTPVVGKPLYGSLHGAKKGLKDFIAPQGMFEDLGLKYVGPIDGHDIAAVESALHRAAGFHGPVLVHCLTEKGRGYRPALEDEADRFHTVGTMDPLTCEPVAPPAAPSWTSVFGDEMVRIGAERADVVALTAAMLQPVGLGKFAAAYPDRVWDVGIAEQHAAVSAAGLATGGLHPVVAVYATFLNRAFDQVLMDVALHRCGVTFVLDRAGVTGTDGASHNGMWDMSMLGVVPGLRIAAPRDAEQLRAELRESLDVDDAPTVIRFPKESVGEPIAAVDRIGGVDVLRRADRPDVLLVAVGVMAPVCLDVADLLGGARHRRDGRRPALGEAGGPRHPPTRRRTHSGGRRGGQQPQRRRGFRGRPGAARRRAGCAAAHLRYPRAVPGARQARRTAGRHRADPGRDRRPDRRRTGPASDQRRAGPQGEAGP